MSGDPLSFAPHLQLSPLAGMTARPVLVQFARADMTMPNPANSALIRAGRAARIDVGIPARSGARGDARPAARIRIRFWCCS